jgi:hypothetical protein
MTLEGFLKKYRFDLRRWDKYAQLLSMNVVVSRTVPNEAMEQTRNLAKIPKEIVGAMILELEEVVEELKSEFGKVTDETD